MLDGKSLRKKKGDIMDVVFLLIVICTAIIGMFSQEFIRLFHRIFSIRGAPLFLPLIVISLVIESHLLLGWAVLTTIHSGLSFFERNLSVLIPHHVIGPFLSRVLILTLLAVIPIFVVKYMTRNNQISNAMFYIYRFSALIWVIAAILFASDMGL